MKYGVKEIVDLYIFDEEGKLVVKLDTLKKCQLKINMDKEIRDGEIFIKDALLNVEFLKFVQSNKEENLSDFERLLKLYEVETITFNVNNDYKKCKVIAKTLLRNTDGIDKVALYEIPNATIVNNFQISNFYSEVSEFDTLIIFEQFNKAGELARIHIQK